MFIGIPVLLELDNPYGYWNAIDSACRRTLFPKQVNQAERGARHRNLTCGESKMT
jgi:hypothetical protein